MYILHLCFTINNHRGIRNTDFDVFGISIGVEKTWCFKYLSHLATITQDFPRYRLQKENWFRGELTRHKKFVKSSCRLIEIGLLMWSIWVCLNVCLLLKFCSVYSRTRIIGLCTRIVLRIHVHANFIERPIHVRYVSIYF